ncbi:hypothetical protein [Streptomyces sp. NPDC093795]|uniref:hypothetical protein n=1 Tax=Streptomyces sp. NPDC093795 TaxID=3366051 RepID=UPI00380F5DB9
MITRTSVPALSLTSAVAGVGLGTAAPASAGGIGDLLSPAFGVSCANLNNGA